MNFSVTFNENNEDKPAVMSKIQATHKLFAELKKVKNSVLQDRHNTTNSVIQERHNTTPVSHTENIPTSQDVSEDKENNTDELARSLMKIHAPQSNQELEAMIEATRKKY